MLTFDVLRIELERRLVPRNRQIEALARRSRGCRARRGRRRPSARRSPAARGRPRAAASSGAARWSRRRGAGGRPAASRRRQPAAGRAQAGLLAADDPADEQAEQRARTGRETPATSRFMTQTATQSLDHRTVDLSYRRQAPRGSPAPTLIQADPERVADRARGRSTLRPDAAASGTARRFSRSRSWPALTPRPSACASSAAAT